jgi:hypothetical protein
MKNSENRPTKDGYRIDEARLQRYNDMKPVTKRILWFTVRATFKMMKWVVSAAFHIPGLVRRMATSHTDRKASRPIPPVQK